MFTVLLFLFVTVPLVEVWLLVTVGGILGPLPTVGIIFATGLLGAAMARREGLKALARVQGALQEGRLPGHEIVSGLMVLVGGVLLLTPGILTDVLGFLCLIPLTREPIAKVARTALGRHIRTQGMTFGAQATIIDINASAETQHRGRPRPTPQAHVSQGPIIDIQGDE